MIDDSSDLYITIGFDRNSPRDNDSYIYLRIYDGTVEVDELNNRFGYTVTDALPELYSADYQYVDLTIDDENPMMKLYLYDWTSSEFGQYIRALNDQYTLG